MVYDEKLAEKIRKIVRKNKKVTEKKMFGGLSFLCDKKMFCGVLKDDLVLRMSIDACEDALKKKNVRPMDFTGRPMKNFVYVKQCSDADLKKWIDKSYAYASSLKKK